MKKLFFTSIFAAVVLFSSQTVFTSCEDEKETDTIVKVVTIKDTTMIEVSANITENTTWKTGKTYVLTTRVAVIAGVTLTIQPGVIVKGNAGNAENATALIIARGAKIMAEGTATSPIVFTASADNIKPGEVIGSAKLSEDLNGLWGGLIVLGNAKISGKSASLQIEGIPASDINGLYGGDKDDDNSGVIKYVSIRFGGANIGEGNEINGLTLGGVGSGTVIENVEIVGNQDDGIEWFGGSVSVKNALVWNAGDDAIDTDQAWSGTLDNFIVISPGDECFELDGGEGSFNAMHTIMNGSIDAIGAEGLADLDALDTTKRNATSFVTMKNIYFFNVDSTSIGAQDFDDNPVGCVITDLEATFKSSKAVTKNYFKKGTDAVVTKVELKANTKGADKSKFVGWTMADKYGKLADYK